MITFPLVRRPLDEVASEVTKSDSSIQTPTHGESVTTAQTSIDTWNKIDASANEQARTPQPDAPYTVIVQWVDGPYDLTSFFRRATYRVQTSVVMSSNAMLTVESLFGTGPGPDLVNKDFLPPAWRESMESIKSATRRTVQRYVVSIEGTIPLFVHMGTLSVRASFGVVNNLALDVLLGTSFIARRPRRVFPSKQNIVPGLPEQWRS